MEPCLSQLKDHWGAGAVLHPITTVLPSVEVPFVIICEGSEPVDKLGLEVEVGSDGEAPMVELAPAIMLLASAGEIVVVDGEVAEGSLELGVDPLVRMSVMMVSGVWSMKARVGPMTISPPNWTCWEFASGWVEFVM
jgi:hypothetical protein